MRGRVLLAWVALVCLQIMVTSGLFHRPLTVRQVLVMKQTMRRVLTERKIAQAVRLSFHDCVGGCDGCLNRNHPDNVGSWLATVDLIDYYYDKLFFNLVSRADFYVLCAIAAIENGIENVNKVRHEQAPPANIPFVYGREDCPTSPFTNRNNSFPDGHIGIDVYHFMFHEFGLNKEETVALLGAHTLGGATGAGASGFEGFWKEDEAAGFLFDERYYVNLMDPGLTWKQIDKSPDTGHPTPRFQWEGRDSNNVLQSFMLNVDVSLRFKLDFNSPTNPAESNIGKSFCNFTTCVVDELAQGEVIEYTEIGPWIEAFVEPFFKMTANVPDPSKLREPIP